MSSPKERSFIRRLNIQTNEERPKSLISYETTQTPLTPGLKTVPPVLMRTARNSVVVQGDFNGGQTPNRRASLGPLEDLVQCPICLDRLNSPKMLNCQHTFCLNCLETEFGGGRKNKIICPTCKTNYELTANFDFNKLPSNLYINSLLKVLKKSNDGGMTPGVSQAEQDFQIRCINCQTICSANNQKCRHCKQNFCTICWSAHMSELSKQTISLDKQLDSAIERLDHRLDDFKGRYEKLNNNIDIFLEEQINILKEKQIALLSETESLLNSGVASYDSLKDRIVKVKTEIHQSTAHSNADQVSTFMSLHKETTAIFQDIAQWGEERTIFNSTSMSIEAGNVDYEVLDVGVEDQGIKTPTSPFRKNPLADAESLFKYYKNNSFKPKLIWTKCSRPAGIGLAPWIHEETGQQLLYIAGTDSRLIYGIDRTKGRIIHRITCDDMVFPNGITFSPERKEIFVSDKWQHCIFVFSKDGEFLRSLGSKGDMEGYFRSPEGIAIGSNNSIYVCDTGNDRVQCLNILDGKMLLQFGLIKKEQLIKSAQNKNISVSADLLSPTGVSFYDDYIIVLDSGHKRVKVFNTKGQKLSEFGITGSLKGQFKFPEVLAIDSLGFIFVGDGGNARIQVYQPNGQLVTTFGNRGSSPGKFGWISGVHVTKDLEVIVTDHKNHTVQIFE